MVDPGGPQRDVRLPPRRVEVDVHVIAGQPGRRSLARAAAAARNPAIAATHSTRLNQPRGIRAHPRLHGESYGRRTPAGTGPIAGQRLSCPGEVRPLIGRKGWLGQVGQADFAESGVKAMAPEPVEVDSVAEESGAGPG